MKLRKKAAALLILACLCISFFPRAAFAEEAYTYTVTFFAGNQGTFSNANGLSVRYNKGEIKVEANKITVSGLELGDIVSFEAQAGALTLGNASKYYIKGIRESGRDNNTVAASAFKVDGDADYVVAYGVKGTTVSYTVNYEDESQNKLAESRTYYGNVGDKAVAAYLYIEGYTPQALAITKTLSANAAENVFTFVYRKEQTTDTTENGTTNQTNTTTGTGDGTSTTTNDGTGSANEADAANGRDGADTDAQQAGENAENANEAGENAGENGANGEEINVPDEETPLSDQELLDLDDEETPLSNLSIDSKQAKKGLPLAIYLGISVAAAVALIVLLVVLLRRRKRIENLRKERRKNGSEK